MVIDRLNKYGQFIDLKHSFTVLMVAEVFIREIVRLHGVPHSIVSNRGRIFMSRFWTELFKAWGQTGTAYQTDGQMEMVN